MSSVNTGNRFIRRVDKMIVKPVFTYVDKSCHFVVRRCGIISQLKSIHVYLRGIKHGTKGAVVVGILGDSDYTVQQRNSISYIAYVIEEEIGREIDILAIEEIKEDYPIKLNANPREWCDGRNKGKKKV